MTDSDRRRVRRRLGIRVDGVVQGVGFRPFVAVEAARLGLTGLVGNDPRGVFMEAEGDDDALAALLRAVRVGPPRSSVESVRARRLPLARDEGFRVVPSSSEGAREALVPADTATCHDCLAEMRNPLDRRYRYPFVNCTNCGPRLTIMLDVPYDRARTTMSGFTMCDACRAEYEDPCDRRFHAEPVCCPRCGPRLQLIDPTGAPLSGDPVPTAAALLRAGAVVAVKGLGGYHLAALAIDQDAVARLRARKHREDRPFALVVPDLTSARDLCTVTEGDVDALTDPARPIVLLPRAAGADRVAPAVAPGSGSLGLMLPYTPLHHLLLEAVDAPLVLTSGNVSDEPIAFEDDDALSRLGPLAEALLVHDRRIHTRVDDSVVRSGPGRRLPIRRSRGFVPSALSLPVAAARPVLACGPELKNTFCLVRGRRAFLSHHIGDLENYETLRSFTDGIEHFGRLLAIEPAVLAHDLHPEYLSTKYAVEQNESDPRLELVPVQHHHAHLASCLADNGRLDPVLGVAFDGLGMGDDGTLWGGEFFRVDLENYTRLAHLAPVRMPGGAAAIRQPWRMTAAYADVLGLGSGLAVAERVGRRWEDVRRLAKSGIASPETTSAGRLFDAVAALVGLRDEVTYEGQAAVELEQCAEVSESGAYRARVLDGEPMQVLGADLVAEAAADLAAGTPLPVISARFHRGVADAVVAVCRQLGERTGLDVVALSGGVFQNMLLLQLCVAGLERAGFEVLQHHRVPPNDGGISLGQAAVAAARSVRSVEAGVPAQ